MMHRVAVTKNSVRLISRKLTKKKSKFQVNETKFELFFLYKHSYIHIHIDIDIMF